MEQADEKSGPVMRLFEAHAKAGRAEELLEKFSKVSVEVVRGEPGNRGFFFGRRVEGEGEVVIFASLWRDLRAVQERFGAEWQSSYLPEGYEDLIEDCSVQHYDLSGGWQPKHEE